MSTLDNYISEYIDYCKFRKHLNSKTIKAYNIDLNQYKCFSPKLPSCLCKDTLDQYITNLHKKFKPKTIKRKIASLKAFFHYLEYREVIYENPFQKILIYPIGLNPTSLLLLIFQKHIHWNVHLQFQPML